jgi:hypothetical protein
MSKTGKAMSIPATAGTEIGNNLILSACIRLMEGDEDDDYFVTMIHSVMAMRRLQRHHERRRR